MSKRTTAARHRATPLRSNPLETVSQAVAANAGTVGRQAAVVAAASGLVLSIGLPAQGSAPAVRETTSIPAAGLEIERTSFTAVNVTAAKDVKVKLDRPEVTSRPAPEPEPEPAPAPVVREAPVAAPAEQAPARTATQTQSVPAQQAPAAQQRTQADAAERAQAERAQARAAERAQARAAERAQAERAQARAAERAQAERAQARAAERAQAERAQARAAEQQRQQRAQAQQTRAAAAPQQQAPAPRATGNMAGVVSAAYSGIGVPYVYGGKTRAGWDCSGFTSWAYRQAGISIPSSTSAIRGSGQFVRTSSPKPGDLVFQNGGGHVGIYVGNGMMIGAQNPSTGTFLHSVSRNPLMGYYTYVG
ncbi:C40 family peptidase [Micrococcus terreus]|uniref:C40 family peptidase n=1 Tax=Micrococcus terreus TaxID=574650 RepID=UPI0030184027